MLSFLKNWTLPVAMTTGSVLYLLFAFTPALSTAASLFAPVFQTLLPLSIFVTLFITFSKVDFHLMRPHRWHAVVLGAQLLLVALLTAIIYTLPTLTGTDSQSAVWLLEAILVCVIAPCASAAPVVTAKLGGDLSQMTTFVLISSVATALLIPAIFPLIEPRESATFLAAFLMILKRLASVLLLPLVLGAIVRHWVKPLYEWFVKNPDLAFYSWSISLSITSGITVRSIVNSDASVAVLLLIALFSLVTSLVQFVVGRRIGRAYGEYICTGQAMFQKNTGLAIWISSVYLNPVAAIGAGCYVLWQNLINSYELWQHRHSDAP